MSARLARAVRDRTGHRSAPAESHFNPTLSHFVPLSIPLRGPNPAESRIRHTCRPCPGIFHLRYNPTQFEASQPARATQAVTLPSNGDWEAAVAGAICLR